MKTTDQTTKRDVTQSELEDLARLIVEYMNRDVLNRAKMIVCRFERREDDDVLRVSKLLETQIKSLL